MHGHTHHLLQYNYVALNSVETASLLVVLVVRCAKSSNVGLCILISQSCQVEIIPERLQAYLMFLSEHTSSIQEEDFTAATVVCAY